ncbi:hypothetical protein [uncultured Campylobacter sp.]|uniref:hypothetical protein n=1 Tax=uncultured Campylobacter sp. TaxID=218934 RepID=UPI0026184C5E|nr:hypothetical protein [uncultured Campylobacter sp.]
MKKIIAMREDANGSRFLAMIIGFYLAKKFDTDFVFHWPDNLFNKVVGVKNNTFCFGEQKIIPVSVDKKEDIFDSDFLNNFHINELNYDEVVSVENTELGYTQEIKKAFYDNNFYKYVEPPFWYAYSRKFKEENEDYVKEAVDIWENKIKFKQNIKDICKKAKNLAKEINRGGGFVSIHVRLGDSAYSYAVFRKYSVVSYQPSNPHTVVELIRSLNQPVVLFGDDISTLREIKKFVNLDNVYLCDDIKSDLSLNNTENFLFDISLMREANALYGTYSAVVQLASLSSNKPFFNTHEAMRSKKHYINIKKSLSNFTSLHKDVLVCSYFQCFLLANYLNIDIVFQEELLKKALDLDFENDKYRLYLCLYYMKYKGAKKAEYYLKEVFKTRKNEFLQNCVAKWNNNTDSVHENISRSLRAFLYCADKKYECINNVKNELLKHKIISYDELSLSKKYKIYLRKMLYKIPYLSRFTFKIT